MPLHVAFGEAADACKLVLLDPRGNRPVNSTALARGCSTARRKCAFLAGSWAGCQGDFRNFLAEQLTVAQICANSGLSSLVGEICANLAGSVGR